MVEHFIGGEHKLVVMSWYKHASVLYIRLDGVVKPIITLGSAITTIPQAMAYIVKNER
jgi:hypothetical protein